MGVLNPDRVTMSGPTSLVSRPKNMIGIFFLFMSVGAQARTLYVIDIGFETPDVTLAQKLSVLSCQGLMNRKSDEEVAVYSLKDSWDQLWLDTVLEQDPDWVLLPLTINEFLSDVCEREKFPKLLYSKSTHHEMIPQIITVAGALSAVPLDIDTSMDQIVSWEDHDVVFNAETEFLGFTELEATMFIFDHYANVTTGVAMMNPGWRAPDYLHPIQNELVRDPDVGLADYIIKERIFNFFLWSGCLPGTEQHELMRRMMSDENTLWEKPVEVYGYNDAIRIFGDIFEAETNCVREHNMGQVASSGQNNFSFFSRKSAIQSPEDLEKYLEVLLQTRQDIADGKIVYDPTKTDLSLIVGDGDNTAFMKGSRRGWMTDRLKYCEENGGCDFPLCLSMSPHLMYLAPHLLYWYYQKANQTQQDVFVLPPSGHLYAYPGMMDDEVVQNSFIQSTQEDCRLLSTTSSVHWEWFFGWPQAFSNYFPKYAENYSNDDVEEHKNKQES